MAFSITTTRGFQDFTPAFTGSVGAVYSFNTSLLRTLVDAKALNASSSGTCIINPDRRQNVNIAVDTYANVSALYILSGATFSTIGVGGVPVGTDGLGNNTVAEVIGNAVAHAIALPGITSCNASSTAAVFNSIKSLSGTITAATIPTLASTTITTTNATVAALTLTAGTLSGILTNSGTITGGIISPTTANVSGTATIGTLVVTGNSDVTGTLSVDGATTLDDTAVVDLTISGHVIIATADFTVGSSSTIPVPAGMSYLKVNVGTSSYYIPAYPLPPA